MAKEKRKSIGCAFYRTVELGEGEVVIRESNAALQTSFILAQNGKLVLTNKRLVFLPSGFFAFYKAKRVIVNLVDIKAVEKKAGDTTNLLAGSLRKRLSIQCKKGGKYIFLLRKLDEWVQAIRDAIQTEVSKVA